MKKEDKAKFVQQMKDELAKMPAMVAADYRGLTVAKLTDLRKRCQAAGVEFKVVKNTLTKLAAEGSPLSGIINFLEGPTAVAWHPEDPGAAAKVLSDFARERDHEALKLKGGAMGKRSFTAEEVKSVMAVLPGREALLARMAGLMQGAPRSLHGIISAGPSMLGRVLNALKEQRAAGAGEVVASSP